MENSIYLAISRQLALRNNMDITANNIANMNTTGFRSQHMLFNEYIEDPKGADDELSFVLDKGQYQTTTAGPMKLTGNQLDVAISGPAYIGITGPGGQQFYTRAGAFQMDAAGIITDASGNPVSDAGGGQIIVPAGSTEIKIDEQGNVSNQDGQIAQIMMVEFENLQMLEAQGNNLYATDQAGIPAENSVMKQGVLEGSNVQPVQEMTNMIDTLRTYQSVQNLLSEENDRLRDAIDKLTQKN